MSGVTIRRIRCDAVADDSYTCMTESEGPDHGLTMNQLRDALAAQGWHHKREGRDICPDCWKEGRR